MLLCAHGVSDESSLRGLSVGSEAWNPKVSMSVLTSDEALVTSLRRTLREDSLSQLLCVFFIQVTNTPETLRKPSHPPPRPPPDYLRVESPPAPLAAHLNRAAGSSPEAGAQIERKESARRPPPSRPMPPAPNCLLSQVSGGFLATLGWGHGP